LKLPILDIKIRLDFGPFEIKTLRANSKGKIFEVNLMEEKI